MPDGEGHLLAGWGENREGIVANDRDGALHLAAGTDTVAFEGLADHGVALPLALEADLATEGVVDAEEARLLIEGDALALEEVVERAVEGQVFGCADGDAPLAVHEPDLVGDLQGQLEVVGRHEDGLAHCPRELVEQLHDLHFAGEIEEGGRLVEEDDRRLLREGFGDHHLLSLAVAQGLDHAMGEMADLNVLESLADDLPVLLAERAPKTGVGAAAEADQLLDAHVADFALVGQHHADHPREPLVRVFAQRAAHQSDLAAQWGLEAGKGAEQGRFARPVGAKQAGELAGADGRVDLVGDDDAPFRVDVAG